jgi:alpha-L-rhamnosidase
VAEYSMWNYDSLTFWEKFLDDIETSRSLNNGIPTNIAPGKRGCNGNANPDWAMAFINLPWFLYLYTGDTDIPKKHWEGMTKLMQHLKDISEDWIVKAGFGDFFDPGTDKIVSHTPVALTSTLWFLHCSDIMKQLSNALDLNEEEEKYSEWVSNIRQVLVENFYDKEKGSFGSQGGNTLAIKFGVLDHEEQSRLVTALVEDIKERDTHMNVGVMGVRYILEVLSENGHGDLALELMHQDSYPSFGHLIQRGATTLWECWGEVGHDGTHGPRSLNHPFMGGYDNWFFNTLSGIQIDPDNPGFKHFFISPKPIDGLEWVKVYHDTPQGRIEVSWSNKEVFELNVEIPEGSTATVILPFNNERHSNQSGNYNYKVKK